MEFHILASGSKGNSTFVHYKNTGLLIDCGISKRQLLTKLKSLGYEQEDIDYVLLTHNHSDHSKNIHIFDHDKIYTTEGNLDDLDDQHTLIPYTFKQLGDFNIFILKVSHDACNPMGLIIEGDAKLLYMTDTGYVSQKNRSYMHNLDYYIIESNHDIEMLMNTQRPMYLKNRILNDKGHLDNTYSAQLMAEMIGDNTKEIVLAHLSQQANSKEKALETYYETFDEMNIPFNKENIKVASQYDIVSGGQHED